ncbi:MAG: aspartate dehydrogenase domain-containing protein [Pseudomonadota bacterium]
MMTKIGLIGYGAIGKGVADHIAAGKIPNVTIGAVLRQSGERGDIPNDIVVSDSMDSFLAAKPNLVLEAAGFDAARSHALAVLEAGIPLILMSISILTDDRVRTSLEEAAIKAGTKLLVPSGALAGIDGVTAARFETIETLTITQKKPPAALLSQDEAAGVTTPRILDELSAREAGQRFPKNANIAAGAGLAAGRPDETLVRIVADPGVTRNTAELLAEGSFGRISVTIENEPTENKRTSRMAILSALSAIARQTQPIVYGA